MAAWLQGDFQGPGAAGHIQDVPDMPRDRSGSVWGASLAYRQWRHGSATTGTPLKIVCAVLLPSQGYRDTSGDIEDPDHTWIRSVNQCAVQPRP